MSVTKAVIVKSDILHNLNVIRRRLDPGTTVSAVVKANAYGHGLVGMARVFNEMGVRHFSVASNAEAEHLVEARVRGKILILGSLLNCHDLPRTLPFKNPNVTMSLGSCEEYRVVSAILKRSRGVLKVHLKVDTGMGRRGVRWDDFPAVIDELKKNPKIQIDGLMTHLAQSWQKNDAFTRLQLRRFESVLEMLRAAGIRPRTIHAANSGAVFNHPASRHNLVRVGLALYGLYRAKGLVPVMTVRSPILQVKSIKPGDSIGYDRTFVAPRVMDVGIIPVGYADGIKRKYYTIRVGLVRDSRKVARTRILGKICMDVLMVDMGRWRGRLFNGGHTPEVILFSHGKGAMRNAPTVREIADQTGYTPYEVVTGIGDRVERLYV